MAGRVNPDLRVPLLGPRISPETKRAIQDAQKKAEKEFKKRFQAGTVPDGGGSHSKVTDGDYFRL